MQIPLTLITNSIEVFLLVFVRLTGLFVIAPIFGRRNIPVYFKVGFSFLLTYIMINSIPAPQIDGYENILSYTLLIFKEFIVGIIIGYVAYLVFNGIYLAGQLIDMQVGFGMVSVFDPLSNIQVPITANFYSIISMLLFLLFNGHHFLIRALYESYKYIPLGHASFNSNLLNDILRVFGNMFVTGFKIAAPIIAAILVADVALGVMSKTVPQMNVFVLGMPLKIALGIAVLIITIPAFVSLVEFLNDEVRTEMFNFIRDMGPNK